VSLYNEAGDTQLIVDVVGWFSAGGSYQAMTPARIADFRGGGATVDNQFRGDAVLAPGESRPIKIAGRAGVPAAAVAAVVLNVTITEPTAASFISVWPAGAARPNASNVNVRAGQTVANAVVVKVGANGEINVFNESGQSRLIIDIAGWFGSVAQQQRTIDTGTGPFAHSCAVGRDTNTWCWGDNGSGQLGQGGAPNAPVVVAGTTGARGVATGQAHSCALVGAGVSCWGANGSGQLGDGTTTARSAPAAVGGLGAVAAITAGANHTCALALDGTVACWGANGSGQLGNGTTTASSTPVGVAGLGGAVAISAGGDHTCAQLGDGTARCWGANGSGQLGNGTTTASSTPVDPGLTGVTAISAGNAHTCAAIVDGTARCWGANGSGQLGNGTTTASSTPVAVGSLSDVHAIAAGPNRTCATTAVGYAFCWGNNSGRSLGNGSNDPSSASPVPVYGLGTAVGAAVGSSSSCAALADGTFRCWGLNLNGQLGDGTSTPSGSPVPVAGP
jgi:alpha-tubulin suppressor-like RCC1 family protein